MHQESQINTHAIRQRSAVPGPLRKRREGRNPSHDLKSLFLIHSPRHRAHGRPLKAYIFFGMVLASYKYVYLTIAGPGPRLLFRESYLPASIHPPPTEDDHAGAKIWSPPVNPACGLRREGSLQSQGRAALRDPWALQALPPGQTCAWARPRAGGGVAGGTVWLWQ